MPSAAESARGGRTTRAGGRGGLAVVLGASLVLGSCGGGTPPRFLSIATGGTGGVYYPYGGGLAKVISETVPGVEATAEVTAASVDNLKFIRERKADLAFTLADTLADAVAGRGAFEGAPVPARALAVLYSNYTHLVTRQESGIRSVGDLRGRVVSTGSPGSGTEVISLRVLEAAGLDPDRDVTRHRLGASESAGALKDGKVDAFFWSGGVPSPAVQDLSYTTGLHLRLVPNDEVLPALQRRFGEDLYFPLTVPASKYPGVDEDVHVVGVSNVLVVHEAMSEDLAHAVTRALFEKQDELAAIHPEAAKLAIDTAVTGSPALFHPGAIRFYREQGRWK